MALLLSQLRLGTATSALSSSTGCPYLLGSYCLQGKLARRQAVLLGMGLPPLTQCRGEEMGEGVDSVCHMT